MTRGDWVSAGEIDLSDYTMQRLADLIGDAVRTAVEEALASTPVTIASFDYQACQDIESAARDGVQAALTLESPLSVDVAELDMQAINDITMAIDAAG